MVKTHRIVASLCVLVVACACSTTPALATEPEAPCPNEQLRVEQPDASGLGDCRAYEMVSPLAKDGNGVLASLSRAAESGEGIVYFSPGSFAEPQSTLLDAPYLARREAGGWSTRNLSPPYIDYAGTSTTTSSDFEELLFTADLSRGVLENFDTPLVSGQPAGYGNLYVANTATGSYEAVTTVTPEAEYKPFKERNQGKGLPEAGGASSDLSHVVFQQTASLTVGASPEHEHVYEEAGGVLRQVDVPPPGGKLEGNDSVGFAVSSQPIENGDTWRAVSADGSRVVFTGGEKFAGTSSTASGQVYVRENPMSVEDCSVAGDACTVEVSASHRTVPDPNAGKGPIQGTASYRGASVDGSRVFFTSRVELTNEADTGPEDNYANLYEYNVETGVLTDVTPENAEGGGVLGLVTAGENAGEENSYLYFVANGVLASNENANKETARPGDCKEEPTEQLTGEHTCSLYVARYSGGKWEAKFVATLAAGNGGTSGEAIEGDEYDWTGEEGVPNQDFGPLAHTVRVTPDGTVLAFESELPLTKTYDNRPAVPGECGGAERCREVYLFDVGSGSRPPTLICASCDPDGSPPVGPARLDKNIGGAYIWRNLSDGGGRLFFETPDALVPHDSNGLVDVYEWERAGEGTCTTASSSYAAGHEGCTFPVSDVAGSSASEFMDASASGDDVFILTTDQLVSSDTDDRGDVYDARVGGGLPVTAAAAVCTNADSCKPPVSPQPGVFGVPASATFSGPGNPAGGTSSPPPPPVKTVTKKTVKCRKGLVKKKVKKEQQCVKKPKPSRRAKKSTHRKGRA